MRLTPAVLLCSAVLLSACNTDGPAYDPPPAGVGATVELTSLLRFAPDTLTVPAGTTVEWQNKSIETHTVSTATKQPDEAGDIALPAGAQPFDSGEIAPGEVYRHTFTVPGTYRYICDPHHGLGMKGTIVVTG